MKLYRSWILMVVAAAGMVCACPAWGKTLRLVSYNIDCADQSSDNNITGATHSIPTVIQGIGLHHIGTNAQQADVMGFTELTSTTLSNLVFQLNSIYGAGTYKFDPTADPNTGGGPDGLIYNTNTVQVISARALMTGQNVLLQSNGTYTAAFSPGGGINGVTRAPMVYQIRPIGSGSNADFYLYLSHARSTSDDSVGDARYAEAQEVRSDAKYNLPARSHIIYFGDWNLFNGSNENAYKCLTGQTTSDGNNWADTNTPFWGNTNQTQAYDPTTTNGLPTTTTWTNGASDNATYIYGDSTTSLKSRIDMHLPNALCYAVYNNQGGVQLAPDTSDPFDSSNFPSSKYPYAFEVFGNNGSTPRLGAANNAANHSLDDLTNTVPSAATVYADIHLTGSGSTFTGSDHYPLVADYLVLDTPAIVITVPPASRTNVLGTTASFTVTATGAAPLSYQWRRGTTNLVNAGNISGVTSTNLTLTNVAFSDAANYSVVVSNSAGMVTSSVAVLTVVCPTITVGPAVLANGTAGTAYNQTNTATGGTAPYIFAVTSGTLPNGLNLNTNTGVISGTPTNTGSKTFTVRATDANGCTGSSSYTVTINCPTITVGPAVLANGTAGTPYNQTNTASGGVGSITFAISSGTLPNGLNLNTNTGVISGTPTNTGSSTFTVRATDANGCTGSSSYTVTINCPTITVGPAVLDNGTAGTPYSETNTASGGVGTITFAISSNTLPNGLNLNTNTGVISGTPTNTGSSTFTVTATDANGCTGSSSYTVTINCPTITVGPTNLADGVAGAPYNQTNTASGGVGSIIFTVSSGALPSGLDLNTNTGVISGTPATTGSNTFTMTVIDANGCTGSSNYTVVIACPTITVGPASLADGTAGVAYNQTNTASGGVGSITFGVSSGSLPSGLNLDTNSGAINGTPTSAGSNTFTMTATDVNGCAGSSNYTIVILNATNNTGGITLIAQGFETNGYFQLELSSSTHNSLGIQGSTNLTDWTDIGSGVTDTNGLLFFQDTNAADFPNRFYRAVSPPP